MSPVAISYPMALIHHHGNPERANIGNRRAVEVE